MKNNFLVVLAFFALIMVGQNAQAQSWNRGSLKTPKAPPTDLMNETQALKVSNETSIQKQLPAPNLFVGASFGETSLASFSVPGANNVTHYNMDHFVPTLGLSLQDFPRRWGGRWGWVSSLAYTYAEFSGAHPIAIHLIPVNVGAAYRYKLSEHQLFIPYGQLGPAAWLYFQRGLDQDNTSAVSYSMLGTVGVSVNLNELNLFDGRNYIEANLQYSRSFLGMSETNFVGDIVSAGVSMVF
jgi:hypothetical protein